METTLKDKYLTFTDRCMGSPGSHHTTMRGLVITVSHYLGNCAKALFIPPRSTSICKRIPIQVLNAGKTRKGRLDLKGKSVAEAAMLLSYLQAECV
jgi:hypothetical protein